MSFVFPKLRFGLSVILLLVALCTALQFVFLESFGSGLPLSADELLQAFYVGFKLDLRLALMVVLSFFALACIPFLNRRARGGPSPSGQPISPP